MIKFEIDSISTGFPQTAGRIRITGRYIDIDWENYIDIEGRFRTRSIVAKRGHKIELRLLPPTEILNEKREEVLKKMGLTKPLIL